MTGKRGDKVLSTVVVLEFPFRTLTRLRLPVTTASLFARPPFAIACFSVNIPCVIVQPVGYNMTLCLYLSPQSSPSPYYYLVLD
jgi:hypothetical protein